MGAPEAVALSELIEASPYLRRMNLSDNHIGGSSSTSVSGEDPSGVTSLSAAIVEQGRLEELELSRNALGVECVAVLAQAVCDSASLRWLKIDEYRIDVKALKGWTCSGAEIDLSSKALTVTDLVIISRCILQNANVTRLKYVIEDVFVSCVLVH